MLLSKPFSTKCAACIAHRHDSDREDSVLFNDAVHYKDYVASVACEWSIGGMLLTVSGM